MSDYYDEDADDLIGAMTAKPEKAKKPAANKEKPTPVAIGHNSGETPGSVVGEELRRFCERYERLEAEKKDITDGQKEIMAEAKGRGYDTKILRKILAERKRDADDISEEEAILEMYRAALGMG